jgi:hypothetical protein
MRCVEALCVKSKSARKQNAKRGHCGFMFAPKRLTDGVGLEIAGYLEK